MESGTAKSPEKIEIIKCPAQCSVTRLTFSPGVHIPRRTVVQFVSVPHEYFLPSSDRMDGLQTGNQPKPWVEELSKLAVGNEAVVGLVREAGAVVGERPEVLRDVHHTLLLGGVEYLVRVLLQLPGRARVLRFVPPDPVVEGQHSSSRHVPPAEQALLRPLHHGLPHLHHRDFVGVPQHGAGGDEVTGGDLSVVENLLVVGEELRHLDTAVLVPHSSHGGSDSPD